MPSLIDIRRRIRSVKSTQQITKAMKMVSAAKLRRAQERVIAARPYASMLRDVLSNVAAAAGSNESIASSPLLQQRPEQRILLVLMTSDRGLAGAFNSNLIKAAQRFIADHPGITIEFELLGRKGRDFFKRREVTVSGEYLGLFNKPVYAEGSDIARKIIARVENDEIDAVYMIYNEFKSVMAQTLSMGKILPISGARSVRTDRLYLRAAS